MASKLHLENSELTWLLGPNVVREELRKHLVMPKNRFIAEQIMILLRQIEVLRVRGKSAPEAYRKAGRSQQSNATGWPTIKSCTA
jgi:hypothetical protein